MLIGSVQQLDVEIAADLAAANDRQKCSTNSTSSSPTRSRTFGNSVDHKRAAAQVDDRAGQRFVHRHISRSEPNDALLVSECFGESLTDGERDVFDRVMGVDVKIARAGDFEVEQLPCR